MSPLFRRVSTGFTLIELLVVVILLGVIAGMVVPNFSQSYLKLQLHNTIDDLASLMRYAQGRSIMQKHRHRLEFDASFSKYWLTENQSQDSEESFQRLPGRMGRIFHIPQEVTLTSPQEAIEFQPDGKMDQLRFYVCRKDDCFTISTQDQGGYVLVLDDKLE